MEVVAAALAEEQFETLGVVGDGPGQKKDGADPERGGPIRMGAVWFHNPSPLEGVTWGGVAFQTCGIIMSPWRSAVGSRASSKLRK
jgi:hypothetical protein